MAFSNCSALTHISIPEKVTNLPVLSDETHFTMYGDYLPFKVNEMFLYEVKDGVLTFTLDEGVELQL